MAGPGGGPPRRSHTKSRKGCETCKRRHIRCDENFPQCRNCTKHKIRCPYNDMQLPAEERSTTPDKPELMWTAEIEATIDQWQRTGAFPFPGLNIFPTPNAQFLSVEDLRLIHHVASISHQLKCMDADGFTLWTRHIPKIIQIGATHKYVMHALLAFSAMHIAYLTECPLVGNMAYEHRGNALKGLQEAIGTFSRDTSDAILAASLVLSWQATDWRSWTQLMQGTRSVIEAMDAWKHESQFGDFIAETCTFPTAPPSPTPDHKPSLPGQEDLDVFTRTLHQLQKVETYLKQNREDTKGIAQLTTFLKGARKVHPNLSVAQQFERLRPLRGWLFYLPVLYLQQTGGSPSALLVIAHYYTVALVMERLFPEIGAAYFGSLSIGPVENIARRLFSFEAPSGSESNAATPLTLMEYPINAVEEFRSRMGWVQPARTQSFPVFDGTSPSPSAFFMEPMEHDSPMSLPATMSDYPPYDHPPFSYSTEDLSLVPAEAAPPNALAPLQLSSPFGNQNYLSIPSPSYGAYSPASSTFGDFGETSSAYSDQDDITPMEFGFSPSTPMMGGSSNFGFVPPSLQPVWT